MALPECTCFVCGRDVDLVDLVSDSDSGETIGCQLCPDSFGLSYTLVGYDQNDLITETRVDVRAPQIDPTAFAICHDPATTGVAVWLDGPTGADAAEHTWVPCRI